MSEPKNSTPAGRALLDDYWQHQQSASRAMRQQIKEMIELMRPRMHKSHYKKFAEACQEIEQGIIDLHIPMPEHYRDQVMELVIARIGLVCAQDNYKFDSFQFKAAASAGFARRGIDAKTGSAPRSSKGASNRSKP